MKYAKVEVEIAVMDEDDAVEVVSELVWYSLNRGLFDACGMGNVRLVEEKSMPMIEEDDIPDWDAARNGGE